MVVELVKGLGLVVVPAKEVVLVPAVDQVVQECRTQTTPVTVRSALHNPPNCRQKFACATLNIPLTDGRTGYSFSSVMRTHLKIDEVLKEIWTCFGATEKQNLDCQKGIYEFLSYAVFQKQSYIGPYNASSYQRVHLPPLVFSTMEISPSVSDTLKVILKDLETSGGKVSLDDLGGLKCKVMDLECQTHLQVKMLNPANRSIPYTVFVAELPQDGLVTQNQHLQKVKITYNACALKVPFNSEGQFSMDVANEINGELQAHYNEGIQVAYLVDEEIGLTLITPKDLCPRGKASEVTHQGMINAVKKRNKY